MADSKISALPASTTPLAGTEVLPIVQSSTTKKVSVDNLTVGRTVTGLNFLASQSSSTGVTGLTLRNDSQAATAGKYSQLKFSGYDTVGTLKDNVYLREVPADDNCVGASLEVWVKASDTIFKTATFDINGNLVPATAAKGVNFTANTPAAGMTSQLLNWYEEGTWTPVYTPASGAFGTIGAVTSGRYRRIGKTVFFWADIRTTGTPDLGTASGQLYITGLPFTASADGGYGQVSIMQKWNLGTAFTNIGVVVDASNTRLYFTKNSSNSAITYIQATELSTATDNFGNLMGIFGMYTV